MRFVSVGFLIEELTLGFLMFDTGWINVLRDSRVNGSSSERKTREKRGIGARGGVWSVFCIGGGNWSFVIKQIYFETFWV